VAYGSDEVIPVIVYKDEDSVPAPWLRLYRWRACYGGCSGLKEFTTSHWDASQDISAHETVGASLKPVPGSIGKSL